jgi:hypothetical protein
MDYVSVAEAIDAPGLRLVLTAGVPGPCRPQETRACLTPRLETHRDMMYERHIALPLDF